MKTTLPAVLFICGLIGLTGISTSEAAEKASSKVIEKVIEDPVQFSVVCLSYGIFVVNEDSVEISYRDPDNHFIEMLTSDNRQIITSAECTFKEIKKKVSSTSQSVEDKQFPDDGEQRYSIGH